MEFFIIFCYIFMSYGLTEIVVFFDGPFDIVDIFRRTCNYISPKLGQLFSCMACTSTWVGIVFSLVNYFFIDKAFTPFNIIFEGTKLWPLIIFMDAMFTCGTTWILYNMEEMFERVGNNNNEE